MEWWGPKAVPGLIEKLKLKDARVREIACRDLSSLGADAAEAVPALIEALKGDPTHRGVRAALRAVNLAGRACGHRRSDDDHPEQKECGLRCACHV